MKLIYVWCLLIQGLLSSNILEPKFENIPLKKKTITSLASENEKKKDLSEIALKNELEQICEIYSKGPVCLGSGARILTKALNMEGILADFSFDEEIEVDKSGNSNVVFGKVKTMRGLNGFGSAAYFTNPENFYKLDHLKKYESENLSFSFAVYIKRFSTEDQECPVILKGEDNPKITTYERAPGVFINQKSGTVSVYFAVKERRGEKGIFAKTFGRVKEGRWTHINVIITKKDIRIYLNGLLDGYASFGKMNPEGNRKPFHIGGDGNYGKRCSMKFGLNHLKIFYRALKSFEIQASVGNPFGIIEPSFIHLGCYDCHYLEAKNRCIKGYQLCSSEELYGGVWQAAEIMGWTDLSFKIFVRGVKQSSGVKGMGICCRI